MQTLLFIKSKLNDSDVKRIEDALNETRLDFKVKKNENCVIINGRNDLVHTAKTVLREAGFDIE